MAFALTYGSFGDIVETARLAKRIIDVLRSGRASYKRQKVISALKGMHDDVATLSTLLDLDSSSPHVQYITDRLSIELTSCRSLMQQLFAKINRSNGVMGRILMALSEETELISWRAEISERRHALHLLLESLNSLLSLEVGEQLGQVKSQVLYIGSEVHNIEAHVQNIGVEVRNSRALTVLGLAASHFLVRQVSSVGSQVQQVQQLIHKLSPRDISDPVFFVTDPLGRAITIQLSYCDGFNDLDRILKAHLHDRPQAGSRYVECGDYNVVSADGIVIRPFDLAGRLRAGIQLEISIIKRRRDRLKPTPQKCPHCDHTNKKSQNNGWIHCSTITCGQKYQITSKERVAEIEEIFSPQTSLQENRTEFFRLVQIEAIYVSGEFPHPWISISQLIARAQIGSLSARKKNRGLEHLSETAAPSPKISPSTKYT
ncbi:hypothetical protein B0H17DRAFT_1060909 [Mycena rosella]|uniref:Ubiquitin-like domain-containing protein n=1 Tax=Mycena rosella TaxID=1033263 RepID=A0AAD7DJI7_MYCRO|nr:hypothetical protein B0H17DRAFT_1060909 [Mycena rosella]